MTGPAEARPDPPGEGAQWVHAAGGSHVRGVIQGGAVGSIISTGDHARFFVGDYQRLGESFLPPWPVFRRVKLERFAGRRWLLREVEAFVGKEPCGYFVLEAAAGLGKTTFMARLVRRWGCAHHFVETTPGPDGVGPALRSLAAQLLLDWKLSPAAADDVLPGAAARPDYLQALVFEAARARDASRPGTPIVVVVDGLDEAGTPAGQNVLGLPRVLPDGVYFIVSQRPVEVALQVEAPRRVFRLEAAQEPNLRDMRRFLRRAARRQPVLRALRDAGNTGAEFVATLLDRSGGVWVYLHYVVEEIERGERLPLTLGSLPRGVWQYYAQHWQRWRDRRGAAWEADLRVLATLAAAQDELPASLLAGLAGTADDAGLRRLLEQWQPFLTVDEAGERRYRLYHASLREFLDGRAETLELTTAERALTRELASATRAAHARIAGFLLSAGGGLDAGLPALGPPDAWSAADRYGVRHLAAHLEAGGRADDLHRLMAAKRTLNSTLSPQTASGGWLARLLPRPRAAEAGVRHQNTWYALHQQAGDVAGYLADLERAWRLADEAGMAAVRGTHGAAASMSAGEAAVLGLRYALVQASINSMAQNVPPALLPLLVREGMWHPVQALTYARHVPDAEQRAEALTRIIPCLPPDRVDEAAGDALRAIQSMRFASDRLPAVQRLLPHLAPERLRHLLDNLDFYGERFPQTLLLGIARHAPAWLLEEVANDPHDVTRLGSVEILGVLLDFLPEPRRRKALADAWLWVRESPARAADALVARHLPEPERSEVLPRVIAGLQWQGYETPEPELVPLLLPHMPDGEVRRAVAALLEELGQQSDDWRPKMQLPVLAALSARLTHDEKFQIADAVFGWIAGRKPYARERAAETLVPHLGAMGIADEVLARVPAIQDSDLELTIIAALAPRLSEQGVRAAFSLLSRSDRAYGTREARSALFLRLAELGHAGESLRDAPEAVRRADWLSAVAAFVDPPHRRAVVEAALDAAGTIGSLSYDRRRFDAAAWAEVARLRMAPEDLREVPYEAGVTDEDRIAPVLAALPEARGVAWLKDLSRRGDRSDALRARALAHLLPWAHGWKRRRMVRRIRRLAGQYSPDLEAGILTEAAANLAGREQVAVIQRVLELAEHSTDVWRRTLSLLAPHVTPELAPRVLRSGHAEEPGQGTVHRLASALARLAGRKSPPARDKDVRGRIRLLTTLAPRLAQIGLAGEIVRVTAGLPEYARDRLLASIAPWLDAERREQLFDGCTSRLYSVDRLATAVAVLEWQTDEKRASALPRLLEFARHRPRYGDEDLLALAILDLLPHVPAAEREQLVDDAMCAAEIAVLDSYRDEKGVLEHVARHAAGCDPVTRQVLWQKAMRRLGLRSRARLAEALGSLVPLLSAIGGLEAVLATRETLDKVQRDWR